ncbi:MAG: hypothetical protein QW244_02160 [Candidatus Pacearchaeota archaeon]
MKKRRINKKSQFFIFASLIGVLIIFSFVPSIIKKLPEPKFYDLSKNFKFETAEIIAKGKLKEMQGQSINIRNYLDNLTREYLKYGLTEDPNLELIYVYGNSSMVIVYNFADENATVYSSLTKELEGGRKKISSTLSLGEIKTNVISEAQGYPMALDYISDSISSPGQQVTIKLANQNYSFSLTEQEQFFLILRTKRENETFISVQ